MADKKFTVNDLYYEIGRNEDFERNADKLLEHGVDINETSGPTFTPLTFACYRGWLQPVKYLVEHGASLEAKNANGINGLIASCMDRTSFSTFELTGIVTAEELRHVTNILGEEFKQYGKASIYLERREIMKYLIAQGIDPTALCKNYGLLENASALDAYMDNAYMNDLSVIDTLVSAGVPLREDSRDFYKHIAPGQILSLSRKLNHYKKITK